MDAALDIGYMTGLGALNERMVIVADIDKLMLSAEIGLISSLTM